MDLAPWLGRGWRCQQIVQFSSGRTYRTGDSLMLSRALGHAGKPVAGRRPSAGPAVSRRCCPGRGSITAARPLLTWSIVSRIPSSATWCASRPSSMARGLSAAMLPYLLGKRPSGCRPGDGLLGTANARTGRQRTEENKTGTVGAARPLPTWTWIKASQDGKAVTVNSRSPRR